MLGLLSLFADSWISTRLSIFLVGLVICLSTTCFRLYSMNMHVLSVYVYAYSYICIYIYIYIYIYV